MTCQRLCVRFGLAVVLFLFLAAQARAETQTWILTADEKALVDRVYASGVLDKSGWKRFHERVRYSPRREGAIQKALFDESVGSRVERDIYRFTIHRSDPSHIINYYAKGGLLSVLKTPLMPLTGFSRVISGQLGEYPLTTFFQFLVVVYGLWHMLPRLIRMLPRFMKYCKRHFQLEPQ